MADPRVSVVIATHNRKATLCRCLDALSAQSYPDHEVIVVDDGSSDGTYEAVRSAYPGVRCVREERNAGAAAARNRGLELATGELVFFTDDDCIPPRDWLERHIAYYREPEIGAVGGVQLGDLPNLYERFDRAWYHEAQGRARRIHRVEDQVALYTNNMSVRREALSQAGFFDERFPRGEDTELSQRIARAGYVLMQDPALCVEHLKVHSLRSYLALWFRRGCGSVVGDLKAGTLCARRFLPLPNVPRLTYVWRDYRALFGGGVTAFTQLWALAVVARWYEVAGRVYGYWRKRKELRHGRA